MFSDMSWLGILTCVYALARLIHYAYLRLEDSNLHPFVQKVLIVFCFILWFISAPVTLIMGIINMMHYRRLEDKVRKDCVKDPSSHNYRNHASVPLEIISIFLLIMVICNGVENSRLESEIESLEIQIEEAEGNYDSGYDAGFEAAREYHFSEGYHEGVADGYNEGEQIGYEKGYYLGYSCSVVDYADDDTELVFVNNMLNTPTDDEARYYHTLYEWVTDWRYEHFGR